METFSALLALCARNSPVTGEFRSQRPVTRSFDVFFDLRLNKRLSKQSRRRWFETPLSWLWRHCNVNSTPCSQALAIGLKMRNISRPWPNLSSSEGSQDISACQMSGHYTVMRSPSNTETTHLKCFIESKCHQNVVKSTDRDQNLIRWSGYSSIGYSVFGGHPPCVLQKMPLIWPVSLFFFYYYLFIYFILFHFFLFLFLFIYFFFFLGGGRSVTLSHKQ